MEQIFRIDQAEQLFWLITGLFKLLDHVLGPFILCIANFIFRENHRLEEKPDTVRKENAWLGSYHYQVYHVAWVVHVHHHAADLGDVEFQVDADIWVEIWVDAAFLEVDDGIGLVSV